MSSQDNRLPQEASSPIVVGPVKNNIAESQDKVFKIAVNTMFRAFKNDMNKFFNEVCGKTSD